MTTAFSCFLDGATTWKARDLAKVLQLARGGSEYEHSQSNRTRLGLRLLPFSDPQNPSAVSFYLSPGGEATISVTTEAQCSSSKSSVDMICSGLQLLRLSIVLSDGVLGALPSSLTVALTQIGWCPFKSWTRHSQVAPPSEKP